MFSLSDKGDCATYNDAVLSFFYNFFHIFLPALVALICLKMQLVEFAITFAKVVLPVPEGPYKIIELSLSA